MVGDAYPDCGVDGYGRKVRRGGDGYGGRNGHGGDVSD